MTPTFKSETERKRLRDIEYVQALQDAARKFGMGILKLSPRKFAVVKVGGISASVGHVVERYSLQPEGGIPIVSYTIEFQGTYAEVMQYLTREYDAQGHPRVAMNVEAYAPPKPEDVGLACCKTGHIWSIDTQLDCPKCGQHASCVGDRRYIEQWQYLCSRSRSEDPQP